MTAFKRYADFVAKLRVPCGFVLVVTFAWLSRPSFPSLLEGIPISLAGLALRAWASGHLEKNQKLTCSGPYAFVRNPLYIGTSLVAAGLVVASQRWVLAAIFAAVFLLVYLPVIRLEEQHLVKLFPGYREYTQAVPALVPRIPPLRSDKAFRWAIYRKNREYNALIGLSSGIVFLIGKIVLLRQP